jgi:hypothetical protein
MALCRVCGADCAESELLAIYGGGGGCLQCNGSPACSRCGHPRKQHSGAFSRGIERCEAQVAIEGTLAVGRCGCAGFTRDAAAFGETPPLVDIVEPTLRIATAD